MKPIKIITSVALIAALAVTATATGAWTDRQKKAHEIAEMARELGLDEENPIIVEAQRLWWEEENAKQEESEPERIYLGNYRVTGYDACAKCCGNTLGITASGAKATVGRTVAMKGLPFGTVVYIEGIGERVVEDRGVGAGWVDVFCSDHAECYAITGYADVWEVRYG